MKWNINVGLPQGIKAGNAMPATSTEISARNIIAGKGCLYYSPYVFREPDTGPDNGELRGLIYWILLNLDTAFKWLLALLDWYGSVHNTDAQQQKL